MTYRSTTWLSLHHSVEPVHGNQCLVMATRRLPLLLWGSNHSLSLTKKTHVFHQHPQKRDRLTCCLINGVISQIPHNSWQLFHLPFSRDAYDLELAIVLLESQVHKTGHVWVFHPKTFLYPQTRPTIITSYVNKWAFRRF